MRISKNKFYILFFILCVSSIFGQTLKVSDLRKAFDYYKPTQHKQLFSKGFQLIEDSISTNQKRFKYSKPNTKEIVELTFTENGEGDEYLTINIFCQLNQIIKNSFQP